jgi:hypothetical protein
METKMIRDKRFLGLILAVVLVTFFMGSSVRAADLTVDGGDTLNVTSDITFTNEFIGVVGTGTLNQPSGTNTVTSDLVLGYNPGSSGTYNLSTGHHAAGTLKARNEYIGKSGSGIFIQTEGSEPGSSDNICSNLYLAFNPGSSGTYELRVGALAAGFQYIGYSGTGTFIQTGGTNNIAGVPGATLYLGFASSGSGTYHLRGGNLIAENIIINPGSALYQSGGNLTVRSSMKNYAYFGLGPGGTAQMPDSGLDNRGTLNMTGGTLTGGGPLINNASLTGYGTISGSSGFTNNSLFSQGSGNLTLGNTGVNENYGSMSLAPGRIFTLDSGATLFNRGTLALNQVNLNGNGALENPYGGVISGPGTIGSYFNNSGGVMAVGSGTTNIIKPFGNSGLIQLTNFTANLTGGELTNSGTIQGWGNVGNSVTNNGTIEALGGTLAFSGSMVNNPGGLMTAGTGNKLLLSAVPIFSNYGVINLTGGTFDNNRAMGNSGQISGYGTFRSDGLSNSGTMTLSGSTTTVQGNVTNQAGGKITVAYNPAIFTGNVVNNGQVKLTDTTVTWAGSFTNNGAYISDPSHNYFTEDLEMGATGYLTGGAEDYFTLGKNFINHSLENTAWNTNQAILTFVGASGTEHTLDIAGADKGKSVTGYTENFAWGTLDLSGQILSLSDGNEDLGGALYVGKIVGLTLDGLAVQDIKGNGFNIYYDPNLNSKLGGLTYDLQEGGYLLASAPVPLPASAWLFLSGLAGLGLMGRGRKKKNH